MHQYRVQQEQQIFVLEAVYKVPSRLAFCVVF
jgi:hypothetical protein